MHFKYADMRFTKYLCDRRFIRNCVAIGDLNHPETDRYVIGNSYIARLYNSHCISQQMLVSAHVLKENMGPWCTGQTLSVKISLTKGTEFERHLVQTI